MEAGMKCVKYLLFIFNLLFAVSGITLIITGGVIQGLYSTYLDFLGNQFLSAPMLFIIVGSVIFLVAFFGCCGAIRENGCMVLTFSVFLGLIFVCELAGGIAAYVLRGEVEGIVNENMKTSLKLFNESGHGGVTDTWNIMQHDLQCCGVGNYTDWFNTPYGNGVNVPDSCCRSYQEHCGLNITLSETDPKKVIFTDGCLPTLSDKIKHSAGVIAGVGVGIAAIQLIGIAFACMLAASIRRNYEVV